MWPTGKWFLPPSLFYVGILVMFIVVTYKFVCSSQNMKWISNFYVNYGGKCKASLIQGDESGEVRSHSPTCVTNTAWPRASAQWV